MTESGDTNSTHINEHTPDFNHRLSLGTPSKPLARPFLKWAGGKGSLLHEICERIPKKFTYYHEPFIGGGAVFFKLQPARAILSDSNEELINAFHVVKRHNDELIRDLKRHRHEKDYFLKIRQADRIKSFKYWSAVQRASRLIYLNRTCFNGLYRLNSRGEFNVPFGRYKNPKILDEPKLQACSEVLENTKLRVASFRESLLWPEAGDFVYLDPPYLPVTSTSSFTSYTSENFAEKEHEELAEMCHLLDSKGVKFLLSNSDTPFARSLYKSFITETVHAPRAINSKGGRRGNVTELLVRNFE